MSELQPGQEFAGHRIERIAGRGGMGVVYEATDLRLKRVVALKVIAPSLAAEPNFQQRFERECELAASIDHPGVIPVYSAGEEDGAAYVTMRYVEGTDLAQMITSSGRLDPPIVATVAAQVGDALSAAHARGLVHRDVKPANILVRDRAGKTDVFLTDFGLTRELSSDTRFTATGAVIGTVDYMAPEQFEDKPVDGRTDVYALGCVLYQALTGSVPFPTEGAPAKLFAHVSAERPSLLSQVPDLPPELDRVIRKAMAKAPADRFQSASDLGMAAAAAIAGTGGIATAAAGLTDLEATEESPVGSETEVSPAPPTGPTGRIYESEPVAAPLPPEPPPPPGPPRPPPPPHRPPQRRRVSPIVIALGVVSVLTAVVIAVVVLGGSDDEGSGGRGGRQAVVKEASAQQNQGGGESQSGPDPEEVAAIAEDVPAGSAVNVTAYKRGLIELEGYNRRVELVKLRSPGTSDDDARGQALDELILNRWMRAEGEAAGITPERVEEELTSSGFAVEAGRLAEVGYLPGGIRLDAEARASAVDQFGETSSAVQALTFGYDAANAEQLSGLVDEWRPVTACTVELAPLSPLCANGPEP